MTRDGKRDYEIIMVPGVYVGHSAWSGSLMILTEDGVRYARSFRQRPRGERFDLALPGTVLGLPWDLACRAGRAPQVLQGREAVGFPMLPPPGAAGALEGLKRGVCINPRDNEGRTPFLVAAAFCHVDIVKLLHR